MTCVSTLRRIAPEVDHALAEHMLSHGYRRRSWHDPFEILVEGADEHAVVGRRVRPIGRGDQLGVAAVLAAGEADDALANLVALEKAFSSSGMVFMLLGFSVA